MIQSERDYVTIEFAVRELPAVGFSTYSLRPEGSLPAVRREASATPPDVTAVQTGIHLGPLPPAHAFLSALPPGVELLSWGALDAPGGIEQGVLMGLRETGGEPHPVALGFSHAPEKAWQVDEVGSKGPDLCISPGSWRQPPRVTLDLGPRETVGLAVRLQLPGKQMEDPSEQRRPAHAVFGRFWEHNRARRRRAISV